MSRLLLLAIRRITVQRGKFVVVFTVVIIIAQIYPATDILGHGGMLTRSWLGNMLILTPAWPSFLGGWGIQWNETAFSGQKFISDILKSEVERIVFSSLFYSFLCTSFRKDWKSKMHSINCFYFWFLVLFCFMQQQGRVRIGLSLFLWFVQHKSSSLYQ